MSEKQDQLPTNVAKMLQRPGVYLARTHFMGKSVAPIYVDAEGRAWSMKVDSLLSNDRWASDVEIFGPLTSSSPQVE